MHYTALTASSIFTIYPSYFLHHWERLRADSSESRVTCQWLRCPIAVMKGWQGEEAWRLPIKLWTNPRRNPFITRCSLGAFLIWKKDWIIHKWRGPVSVVHSVGVSLLSVAEVFLADVWHTGTKSRVATEPLTFHLVISFTVTGIHDFFILLQNSEFPASHDGQNSFNWCSCRK